MPETSDIPNGIDEPTRIEVHRQRHITLHKHLDELIADFINQTGKRPSQTTLVELMLWSSDQAKTPTGTY